MFTGLIQAIGSIQSIESKGRDKRVTIETGQLPMIGVELGASIAVNGVCLTALDISETQFSADVSAETVEHTTFASMQIGTRVNLELSLTPSSRLGGHFVSGHVDGVGEVLKRYTDGRSERFVFKAPMPIMKYIAQKGSICINGVSLTVNEVSRDSFGVNIVPHTLQETVIGDFSAGTKVNLEVDVIARYLERLLENKETSAGVTTSLLTDAGFIKD